MKPMLAEPCPDNLIRFPAYFSAKLDGVRGLNINGDLRSRSLKPIPNRHISTTLSRADLHGLDGEIVVGSPTAPNVCMFTTGTCSDHNAKRDFAFFVFDDFSHPGTFAQRVAQAEKRVRALEAEGLGGVVMMLPQQLCNNLDEMAEFEARCLGLGFEGLIGRKPDGLYKQGRSTAREQGMFKVKRFVDDEAVIIAVEEEMENTNTATTNELGRTARSTSKDGLVGKGRMGALRCIGITGQFAGVEFSCGGGFNAKQREWFWKHRAEVVDGSHVITFKHFPIGVKDAPRFPIFKVLRPLWDRDPATAKTTKPVAIA